MSRSDWVCSKCGKYFDPQCLDYETGKCWTCQDGVVESNIMKEQLEKVLAESDALSCVWSDIPEELREDLIKRIFQVLKDK